MCRMYNDLGSTVRDLDEGNLNSIEFPEFERHESLNAKMSELIRGEYERSCMFKAFTELRNHGIMNAWVDNDAEAKRLAERRFRIWKMFCDEVDLYGQVYVMRDISSRLENQSKP
ncbi:hypothetical protein CFE70_004917 [Pyrenophora teres f. teres 0-1]|uniref:Uncharacterized protein n=2 Tax=Pyrenophora teres f. teres TaxID=97479 RepID=E3RJG4_PYRTT|nr:hypothetical protein PTT_08288 [Pyrenophora teres f. teres 0-1]KAE8833865.1 hypothetical protein HRS9139_05684 [Pyrenophora teres f. teres]KAE8840363.1 hypothetical protein PTNB85_03762 [Pyrenophora teres f. teres]KAE8849497.1 hypothetical protein HRS9122_03513 [Pyrenophora teres f. teres]KAE8863862.1 hypothetical protein PTNB29_03826 [Pyrenophora teres f. teres]